jgi:acyl-CoA synthetase (NDP forming)
VSGDDAVRAAFARILASAQRHAPHAHIDGVRVQPMAGAGVEMLVGVQHDRDFGPMLVVGSGGIFVEILADAAMAPAPVSRAEALRLIASLAGAALLAGARGRPPADVDALADLMVTVSRFAAAHAGRIESLDLNPVIVHARGEGLTLADALLVTRAAGTA